MKYFIVALILSTKLFSQNITSDLVLCMPMNGNAQDLSGNSNNGIVNGATLTTDRFGNTNSAYYFNGTSSSIVVSGSTSLDSIEIKDEITISAWCRVDGWYNNFNVFSIVNKYNSTSDWGWDYTIQSPSSSNGQMFIANYPVNLSYYTYTTTGATTLGQWDFYTVTFSKSNGVFKAYKNAVLINTVTTNSIQLESTNNGTLYIGYSPGGPGANEYAKGCIDELKIYSRALNATEITTLYNGGQCSVSSVNEIQNNNSLCSIFPNPSLNQINVKIQANEYISNEIEFDILSYEGKLVRKQTFKKNELGNYSIDLSEIASGFYMLKFSSGTYIQNMKFIKE